jgi:hypothetical protein
MNINNSNLMINVLSFNQAQRIPRAPLSTVVTTTKTLAASGTIGRRNSGVSQDGEYFSLYYVS